MTRTDAMDDFLARAGWASAKRMPLSGDASFRRYIRLHQNGHSAMLMDAPPEHEDIRPFTLVGRHLAHLEFSAPDILAEDETHGFLLLEDFGDTTFTNLLNRDADATALYRLATDTLIALHALDHAITVPDWLAPYDDSKLLAEAALFLDWFLPAQDIDVSTAMRAQFERMWMDLFAHVHRGPKTLVLRDFHVDNLMLLDGRDSIRACGLLDFQDAVAGHPAYDVMSLLEDARRDVPDALQGEMKARYFEALNIEGAARDDFETAYAILGAARHAKVIGIFTRLDRRDGKAAYLKHIDRVWGLLARSLEHPQLGAIKAWMDTHVPSEIRTAPHSPSAPPSASHT